MTIMMLILTNEHSTLSTVFSLYMYSSITPSSNPLIIATKHRWKQKHRELQKLVGDTVMQSRALTLDFKALTLDH